MNINSLKIVICIQLCIIIFIGCAFFQERAKQNAQIQRRIQSYYTELYDWMHQYFDAVRDEELNTGYFSPSSVERFRILSICASQKVETLLWSNNYEHYLIILKLKHLLIDDSEAFITYYPEIINCIKGLRIGVDTEEFYKSLEQVLERAYSTYSTGIDH